MHVRECHVYAVNYCPGLSYCAAFFVSMNFTIMGPCIVNQI